jgi:hypothetical protein
MAFSHEKGDRAREVAAVRSPMPRHWQNSKGLLYTISNS